MKTSLVVSDEQIQQIDRVAKRLGLTRAEAMRYLINHALSIEQTRGAAVDQGDGTRILASLAGQIHQSETAARKGGRR